MSLMFPVMAGVILAVIYFSGQATKQAESSSQNQKFSFAVTDESGVINKNLLEALKTKTFISKQQGIDAVTSGKLDAYFYYPKDVAHNNVEIYGNDVGIFKNSRYNAMAGFLLSQSVSSEVSATDAVVLQNKISYQSTTYQNGQIYDGLRQLIAPGVFLVLFYLLIVTFGNQMLASTTEEKENRVIEMILTTLEARTLIFGKIISLVLLGFLQSAIVLVPIIAGYLLLHDKLALPSLDLSNIPLDWPRVLVSALIFIVSFIMFTGLLVTVGAAAPTAKEASGFFGIVVMLLFGPLYAASLFVSSPNSGIVQFLSYFPLTAPIPLMLRNAVGNLEFWQAGISIIILVISTLIILNIAVRAFRYGALEYSRRLSLREIFRTT